MRNIWVVGTTLTDASAFIAENPGMAGSRLVSPASASRIEGALVSSFVLTPTAQRRLALVGRGSDVGKLAQALVRCAQKFWAGAY